MRGSLIILVVLTLTVMEPSLAAESQPPWPRAGTAGDAVRPSFFSRHRRTLLWTAGITATGAATMAILTRRQANDSFAEYERAADPQRIAELYDKTVREDDIAAAYFIVAEVAFASAMVLGFFVDDAEAAQNAGIRLGADEGGATLGWTWSW